MTTALALDLGFERPSIFGRSRDDDPAPRGGAPSRHDASHHRLTLDDLLVGVWEGLSSHHTVTCPVCSGKMTPRYGSGARPVGGRCGRCGSTLG
jgi:DnaJ-class molecular chaperone